MIVKLGAATHYKHDTAAPHRWAIGRRRQKRYGWPAGSAGDQQ